MTQSGDDIGTIRELMKQVMRRADEMDGNNDGTISRANALRLLEGENHSLLGIVRPETARALNGAIDILRNSNVTTFARYTEDGINNIPNVDVLLQRFGGLVNAGQTQR